MSDVTATSALPRRFLAWMGERFPVANGILALVLFAGALLCGRALAGAGPVAVRPGDLLGFLAVYGFFLMLRVFDEHKDYAADCVNHPGRVLQRGLITLSHLKVAGLFAILAQAGGSVYYDHGFGRVAPLWLATFGWSLLMAREFFVPEWLRQRFALYTISHMLVMPIAMLWMVQMGLGATPLPASAAWLAALSFLSGLSFELARKLKAPADERDGVDSYTRLFGTTRAPLVVLAVVAGAAVALGQVVRVVRGGTLGVVAPVVLALAVVLPAVALLRFRAAPSAGGAKLAETLAGAATLIGYLLLAGTVIAHRGVAWR
jgi:4-hydroxybenzoate polyprenyltransferase